MYTHLCIKCNKPYKNEDPDPYYCETCLKEKKAIAEEVDRKIQAQPKREIKSALQEYDSSPKVHGFIRVSL